MEREGHPTELDFLISIFFLFDFKKRSSDQSKLSHNKLLYRDGIHEVVINFAGRILLLFNIG